MRYAVRTLGRPGLFAVLSLLLSIVATSVVPATSTLDFLELSEGSGYAVFHYTYLITVEGSGGGDFNAVFTVTYNYRVELERFNSTHVRLVGFTDGNVTTAVSAGSRRALKTILLWFTASIESNLEAFTLPNVDTLVRVDEVEEVMGELFKAPLLKQVNASLCSKIKEGDLVFTGISVSAENVEAVFECRSGLLYKYIVKSASTADLGGTTAYVTTYLLVELIDTNLARELFTVETGGSPVNNQLVLVAVLATAAFSVAAVALAIQVVRLKKSLKKGGSSNTS